MSHRLSKVMKIVRCIGTPFVRAFWCAGQKKFRQKAIAKASAEIPKEELDISLAEAGLAGLE